MALGNRDAGASAFLVGAGVAQNHDSWRLADEFDSNQLSSKRRKWYRCAYGYDETACAAFRRLLHPIREGADRVSRGFHRRPADELCGNDFSDCLRGGVVRKSAATGRLALRGSSVSLRFRAHSLRALQ